MYIVYILQSDKDERTYTGYTHDIQKRLQEHNSGSVNATKNRRPLKILYTEETKNLSEAIKREFYWKSGAGRRKMRELFFNKGS